MSSAAYYTNLLAQLDTLQSLQRSTPVVPVHFASVDMEFLKRTDRELYEKMKKEEGSLVTNVSDTALSWTLSNVAEIYNKYKQYLPELQILAEVAFGIFSPKISLLLGGMQALQGNAKDAAAMGTGIGLHFVVKKFGNVTLLFILNTIKTLLAAAVPRRWIMSLIRGALQLGPSQIATVASISNASVNSANAAATAQRAGVAAQEAVQIGRMALALQRAGAAASAIGIWTAIATLSALAGIAIGSVIGWALEEDVSKDIVTDYALYGTPLSSVVGLEDKYWQKQDEEIKNRTSNVAINLTSLFRYNKKIQLLTPEKLQELLNKYSELKKAGFWSHNEIMQQIATAEGLVYDPSLKGYKRFKTEEAK